MGYTEADAIEKVRLHLWVTCEDFPLTDLHGWQATYVGEAHWSVICNWTLPGEEVVHLEWRVYELESLTKPANQATAIFEDILRSWCRSLRLW
jgi:hypothetical protein